MRRRIRVREQRRRVKGDRRHRNNEPRRFQAMDQENTQSQQPQAPLETYHWFPAYRYSQNPARNRIYLGNKDHQDKQPNSAVQLNNAEQELNAAHPLNPFLGTRAHGREVAGSSGEDHVGTASTQVRHQDRGESPIVQLTRDAG